LKGAVVFYLKFRCILIASLILFAFSTLTSAQTINWREVDRQTVQYLQKYLSIDTTNPPGDVSQAAQYLYNILSQNQVPTELIWTKKETGRVNLLAHLKGSGKKRPLLLLHHMDTVPVVPSAWTVEPLSGIKKDGSIYGRGALDMKNNGIVQLMTMILLKKHNINLDRDVYMLAVTDEETSGELGAGWIAENMWDQIDAEFVLDEGGFGTQGFFTKDDRLVFSVGVAEKKVMWLRLTTNGASGHGSMPPKENSNFIMARALGRVADYQTPIHITPVVAGLKKRLGALDAPPYNNALQRNTISLTVLNGFVGDPPKSNVIPGVTQAVLDCRLLPDQDPNEFVNQLKTVINDPRVKIDYIEKPIESIVSPYQTELFEIIENQCRSLFPKSLVVPHLVIYGTDSRYFRQKGAACYGFFPGPVSMQEYRTIHGNDERIRESSLTAAVKIYYHVVMNFCRQR